MIVQFFQNSQFSWDGKEYYQGLICLCHIQPQDGPKAIAIAVKKIKKRGTTDKKVVLVPYDRLDSEKKSMKFDQAKPCFDELAKEINNSVCVPFDTGQNELHLRVPKGGGTGFFVI